MPRSWGRYSDIVLWNPLTGEYKTLSRDYSHANRFMDIILWSPLKGDYKRLSKDDCLVDDFTVPVIVYGLYYSVSDNDYKLLRVTLSNDAYIYSLKSDSWRKIESTSFCPSTCWNSSYLLNENLYFFTQGKRVSETDVRPYPIIRFDTKTENRDSGPVFGICYASC